MRNMQHTAVRKCKITDLRSGVSVGKATSSRAQAEFPRSASQNSSFSSGRPGNLYSQVTIIFLLLRQNPPGRITDLSGFAIYISSTEVLYQK